MRFTTTENGNLKLIREANPNMAQRALASKITENPTTGIYVGYKSETGYVSIPNRSWAAVYGAIRRLDRATKAARLASTSGRGTRRTRTRTGYAG